MASWWKSGKNYFDGAIDDTKKLFGRALSWHDSPFSLKALAVAALFVFSAFFIAAKSLIARFVMAVTKKPEEEKKPHPEGMGTSGEGEATATAKQETNANNTEEEEKPDPLENDLLDLNSTMSAGSSGNGNTIEDLEISAILPLPLNIEEEENSCAFSEATYGEESSAFSEATYGEESILSPEKQLNPPNPASPQEPQRRSWGPGFDYDGHVEEKPKTDPKKGSTTPKRETRRRESYASDDALGKEEIQGKILSF